MAEKIMEKLEQIEIVNGLNILYNLNQEAERVDLHVLTTIKMSAS
jgi:hypothetical protein